MDLLIKPVDNSPMVHQYLLFGFDDGLCQYFLLPGTVISLWRIFFLNESTV
jgi:hypothetical protein